jgi:transposase-like protein
LAKRCLNSQKSSVWAPASFTDGCSLQAQTNRRSSGAQPSELRRLRAEITHLRMENDILKKAAVILGTQTPSRPAR